MDDYGQELHKFMGQMKYSQDGSFHLIMSQLRSQKRSLQRIPTICNANQKCHWDKSPEHKADQTKTTQKTTQID